MSLAITGPNGVLFASGFGHADLATGAPATESTQYLWFSLTKIATATAAMHLVDLGKLDLDQPVADFVAGYRTGNSASPTVRQLLNHTAGVANPIPVRWVRPADQPAPEPREFLDTLLARYGTPKYPDRWRRQVLEPRLSDPGRGDRAGGGPDRSPSSSPTPCCAR